MIQKQQNLVFRQNICHKLCIKIDIVFLEAPLQITHKYRFWNLSHHYTTLKGKLRR